MRRYHVTLNATTTAGGKLLAATSLLSISGQRMAQEGDAIYCPACKSEGRIVCVGPRIPERAPKPVALSDDLCKCRCPILPKLVAAQSLRYQTLEDESAGAFGHAHLSTDENAVYDEAFRAVDSHSGEPLAGVAYRIVHPGGAEVTGLTDERGLTARVYTATREPLELYWLGSDPDPEHAHDDDEWEANPCQ